MSTSCPGSWLKCGATEAWAVMGQRVKAIICSSNCTLPQTPMGLNCTRALEEEEDEEDVEPKPKTDYILISNAGRGGCSTA
eukprot:552233-Amphidinium_carterae.1